MVNAALNSEKKSCFVICPFGNQKESGDERLIWEEMRALDERVFAETAKLCAADNLDVTISDARGFDEKDARTIRDTVLELIDNSDAVIMVMTNNKPNAFIELGWAMGLWRDPIILRERKCIPPSDINDMLVVEYDAKDLAAGSAHVAEVAAELSDALQNRLNGEPRRRPFNHFYPTQLAHGKVDLLGRFHNITPEQWSQQFYNADDYIILASSAMLKVTEQTFFDRNGDEIDIEDLLLERALEGIQVTIMMQHPENYSIDHLRRSSMKKGVNSAIDQINLSFKVWNTQRRIYNRIRQERALDLPENGFRVVQMRKRFLPFRASMTDKEVFYTLRFYTQKLNSGVCMIASPDPHNTDKFNPPLFDQIREELAYLISENEGDSEKDYADWLKTDEAQEV